MDDVRELVGCQDVGEVDEACGAIVVTGMPRSIVTSRGSRLRSAMDPDAVEGALVAVKRQQ